MISCGCIEMESHMEGFGTVKRANCTRTGMARWMLCNYHSWTYRQLKRSIWIYPILSLITRANSLKEWTVEVSKALAALRPLYGKDNIEIITLDGQRVRGTVRSMKTTQALTTPSVKMECANGELIKIPFPSIAEIKDHN